MRNLVGLILMCVGIVASDHLPRLDDSMPITSILVIKSDRRLIVYSNGQPIKTYPISLGRKPVGDKHFKGDYKTPEGDYTIESKSARSCCYKNLGISYPNESDIAFAKKQGKSPGGDIKIHGMRNGVGFIGRLQRLADWTAGCIAVSNSEMDELYKYVPIGTPIKIIK